MKKILSVLLCILLLSTLPVLAASAQELADSGYVGIWIENDGYGTLTVRMDGTATMIYYDNTVTECSWALTEDGAKFTDGMWYNSPMELLEENTLSVSGGWMIFTREGFLPITDPALLLGAEPVGEEGEPFLGEWTLTGLTIEGEAVDPSFLTMNLTFFADGTMVSDDGMEPYTTVWIVSYGSAVVEGDILTLDENDQLHYIAGDGEMVFTRVPAEEPELPEEPEIVEDPITSETPEVNDDPEVSDDSFWSDGDFWSDDSSWSDDDWSDDDWSDDDWTDDDWTNNDWTNNDWSDDAEPLNPVPVGEEGAPFLGSWTLTSIEFDGMSMDPAMLGMTMTVTFTEDGLAVIADDLDTQTTTWYVENGAAIIDGAPLTPNGEGQLVMTDEDGTAMIFSQGITESGKAPSDAEQLMALLALMGSLNENDFSDLPEELQGFVGEWYLCYVATGGLTGDLRPLGVTGALSLYADGTGVLSGLADESGEWYDDEGVVRFGESGMPLFLHGSADEPEDFFLQYGSEMGGYMIFHQDETAVWDPAVRTPLPLPGAVQETLPVVQTGAAPVSGAVSDHLNIRFVCTQYTSAGYTMDASMLGAEYALLFRDNGTADFTMAGFLMANLPYTVTDDGVYAINYYGNMFNCTPTDSGFDMDYYGTMTMHFVPAE